MNDREILERCFVFDERVSNVEQNLAVIGNTLSEVKQCTTRLEHDYKEHLRSDDIHFTEIQKQIVIVEKDLIVQKGEIINIKTTMQDIQKTVASMSDQLGKLQNKLAYATGALAVLTVFKDPVLRMFGLM